jgi:ATP-binding cassette subfamily C protein CydD
LSSQLAANTDKYQLKTMKQPALNSVKKEIEKGINYPEFMNNILIKKENGWDTELTNNGVQLSGGERQLVTLARMMLHPKRVAILDEPTSNLDSLTTEVIISEIVKMAEERLVIVASHEQRFELFADNVINLNWGEQMNYA